MKPVSEAGRIVILNGVPRSGKSSIAAAIQDSFEGVWMNLGVDVLSLHATPPRYRPGIGLRPGAERPEVEALVPALYASLFDSVAAHSRHGFNVVVDVGLHDAYSRPLGVLADTASRLEGFPVLLVGVRCPVEEIMRRRDAERSWVGERSAPIAEGPSSRSGVQVPEPVWRWQEAVHTPGIYDLELDTSVLTPPECAARIRRRLDEGPPPAALQVIARGRARP
jgi:chloramphenicol 3-O phosphotransferase